MRSATACAMRSIRGGARIMALLDVDDLRVTFRTPRGALQAVKGVSFQVEPGRCLGIVGESGSGKSQTMLGLLGLLPDNGVVSGSALFEGQELRSEEHTSELQSLMRISYAVFCLTKKNKKSY